MDAAFDGVVMCFVTTSPVDILALVMISIWFSCLGGDCQEMKEYAVEAVYHLSGACK